MRDQDCMKSAHSTTWDRTNLQLLELSNGPFGRKFAKLASCTRPKLNFRGASCKAEILSRSFHALGVFLFLELRGVRGTTMGKYCNSIGDTGKENGNYYSLLQWGCIGLRRGNLQTVLAAPF